MTLFKLFFTFFKIGAFTFGGGYAMIPLIQEEVVNKNQWLNDETFLDAIAISQSAPGAIAVNSSIFIGYKLRGIPGVISCTLGTVLPSFFIILIISVFLYKYRENKLLEKFFIGIRPAVVSLILVAVYKLGKNSKLSKGSIIISILALTLILLGTSPIIVILLGAIGAIIYFKYIVSKPQKSVTKM